MSISRSFVFLERPTQEVLRPPHGRAIWSPCACWGPVRLHSPGAARSLPRTPHKPRAPVAGGTGTLFVAGASAANDSGGEGRGRITQELRLLQLLAVCSFPSQPRGGGPPGSRSGQGSAPAAGGVAEEALGAERAPARDFLWPRALPPPAPERPAAAAAAAAAGTGAPRVPRLASHEPRWVRVRRWAREGLGRRSGTRLAGLSCREGRGRPGGPTIRGGSGRVWALPAPAAPEPRAGTRPWGRTGEGAHP